MITVPESRAASLYKWQEEFLVQGKNGDANEKTATIELLDASMKGVLFTLSLKGVGLVRFDVNLRINTVKKARLEL